MKLSTLDSWLGKRSILLAGVIFAGIFFVWALVEILGHGKMIANLPSQDLKHSIIVQEEYEGDFYLCHYAIVSNNFFHFPKWFYTSDSSSGCGESGNPLSKGMIAVDWYDNEHIAVWRDDKMRICSINALENIESCKVKAPDLGR